MKFPPSKAYKGYDHIHWTVINGKNYSKLIKHGIGTLSQPKSKDDGKLLLVGRASDGYHYTLEGTITKAQFKRKYGLSL